MADIKIFGSGASTRTSPRRAALLQRRSAVKGKLGSVRRQQVRQFIREKRTELRETGVEPWMVAAGVGGLALAGFLLWPKNAFASPGMPGTPGAPGGSPSVPGGGGGGAQLPPPPADAVRATLTPRPAGLQSVGPTLYSTGDETSTPAVGMLPWGSPVDALPVPVNGWRYIQSVGGGEISGWVPAQYVMG